MNWYNKVIAESHKFSTVMLEIDGSLRTEIMKFIDESIQDCDVASDGKEDNPHVTALYGLHTGSTQKIKDHIADVESFEITLGKISKFTTSDEHDVLKVEIESSSLRKIHSLLKELPYTSTHKDYNPHLTLAYVNKGACEDLVGSDIFSGKKFDVNTLVFSSKTEDKTNINLQ